MASEKAIKLLEISIALQSVHDSVNRAIDVMQRTGERKKLKAIFWQLIDVLEKEQKEIKAICKAEEEKEND